MTVERMLELHLLVSIFPMINQEVVDVAKMSDRLSELMNDFIKPYVIDTAEKSE